MKETFRFLLNEFAGPLVVCFCVGMVVVFLWLLDERKPQPLNDITFEKPILIQMEAQK